MLCLLLAPPGQNIGAAGGAGMATLVVTAPIVDTTANGVCAPNAYILITASEYQTVAASPFNITPTDGAAIGGAVMLVWALGFGIRSIIRVLRESGDIPSDSE